MERKAWQMFWERVTDDMPVAERAKLLQACRAYAEHGLFVWNCRVVEMRPDYTISFGDTAPARGS